MVRYKISNGYMFLYQLVISCWLSDITNPCDVRKILGYAIKKYNVFKYRKDVKVTDDTLWVFNYHIRKHIPELRMIDGTIYGKKTINNTNKNTAAFKIILALERIDPSDSYNPIFRKIYPTDTILLMILQDLNITIKKQQQ